MVYTIKDQLLGGKVHTHTTICAHMNNNNNTLFQTIVHMDNKKNAMLNKWTIKTIAKTNWLVHTCIS